MTEGVSAAALLIAETSIRWLPVFGGVLVLTMLLRSGPAANRHLAWLCALFALAALPLLERGLATRQIGIALPMPAMVERDAPESAFEPVATAAPTATRAGESSANAARPAAASPRGGRLPVSALFAWLWSLGAAVLIVREILTTIRIRHMVAIAVPVAPPTPDLQRYCRSARIAIRSADVPIPVVCGVIRPTILMPLEASEWPDEWWRAAIMHEAAHVQRGDLLWRLLGRTLCAVFWFHPAVWLAQWRLHVESEQATDDAVLARGMDRFAYAGALLELARRLGSGRGPAHGLAIAGRSSLPVRLRRISERHPYRLSPLLAVCTLLFALTLATGAAAPAVPPAGDWLTAQPREDGGVIWRMDCRPGASECEALNSAAVELLSAGFGSGIVAAVDVRTGRIRGYAHLDRTGSAPAVPALSPGTIATLPLAALWWDSGMGDRPQPCPAVINLGPAGAFANGNGLDTGIVRAPLDVIAMQCATGAIAMGWYLTERIGTDGVRDGLARLGFGDAESTTFWPRDRVRPEPAPPRVPEHVDQRSTWILAGSEHGTVRTSPLHIAAFLQAAGNDGYMRYPAPGGFASGGSGARVMAQPTARQIIDALPAASTSTAADPDRRLVGLTSPVSLHDAPGELFAGIALNRSGSPHTAIVIWLEQPAEPGSGVSSAGIAARLVIMND